MTSRHWSGRGGITRGGLSRGIPPSWSLGRPRNPDDFGYENDWNSRYDRDRRDMEVHKSYGDYEKELIVPSNRMFMADAFTDDARGFKRPYGPPPPPPIQPKRFQANTYYMPFVTGPRPALPRGQAQPKAAAVGRPRGAHHPARSAHIFRGEHFLSRMVKSSRYDNAVGLVFCDIKESLVGRKNVPIDTFEMKKIKERIRERLSGLLLDKNVPSAEDMLKMYRAKYGVDEDETFLLDIKNSMDQDFVDYVNGNLSSILSSKLDDMFNKVNRLYSEEAKTSNSNGHRLTEDVEMKEEETERKEAAVKENADYYRLLDYMLKEQLPKVLPQFKHHMISILCHDSRFTYTDDKNGDEHMAQDQDKEKTKLELSEGIV